MIAAGLVVLAEDVTWADRALRIVRRRMPGGARGRQDPCSTLLVGGLLMAAGVAVSLWSAFR